MIECFHSCWLPVGGDGHGEVNIASAQSIVTLFLLPFLWWGRQIPSRRSSVLSHDAHLSHPFLFVFFCFLYSRLWQLIERPKPHSPCSPDALRFSSLLQQNKSLLKQTRQVSGVVRVRVREDDLVNLCWRKRKGLPIALAELL